MESAVPAEKPTGDMAFEDAENREGFEYSFHAKKVLGALWLMVLLVMAVPTIGASILNAQMIQDLQMDRAAFGMGFGLFIMMMGLPGPVVAIATTRLGYKWVTTIGCSLFVLGAVSMATWVTGGWQFAVAFGLLIGAGVAFAGMLPAQTVVAKWFFLRRALAISVVLSAIEVGGFISPPGLDALLSVLDNDWRLAWWFIAALGAIALITATVVIDEAKIDRAVAQTLTADSAVFMNPKVHKSTFEWTLKQAIRTRTFWFLLLFVSFVGICWVFVMAHGVVHLQDIGLSSADSAIAVAILVVGSFIGNVGAGVWGDRIPPHYIAVVAVVLMAVGLFLMMHPEDMTGILAYALPLGIGYGATQVCTMALIGNYYGKNSFPMLFGVMMPPSTILSAVGAGVSGALFDATGTYLIAFWVSIMLCLILVPAMLLATPPKMASV
ncbi:putative transporter [Marinobacterium lacunae]|uniref:Putative transporter n=1 Tax=Marinobacterium lacunae TaxID=1232683 RepID=A0A081FX61_9GAMM|nr:MFS transporter [Marinobacterium lacunae]KEA63116.1 putative transporter [Marinobacterium lacunae]